MLYPQRASKTAMLNKVTWGVAGVLVAAAAYELVLALRHQISPDGEGFVLLIALVAMLVGAVLVSRCGRPAAMFAPAAACFVAARLYTGDPYYGPTFRAYGDGGVVSPAWVFGLLGLALLAAITTFAWRRTAVVESVVLLVILMLTAFWMGTGH